MPMEMLAQQHRRAAELSSRLIKLLAQDESPNLAFAVLQAVVGAQGVLPAIEEYHRQRAIAGEEHPGLER